ncbi:MAG: hypothetical protein LBN29_13510 [Mediterranea sp.]|jgi:hypothetical protein|nr:hypothetical protein [Mediterranea sp.]
MKTKTFALRFIALSSMLCLGMNLSAQLNYRPGYIITLARDTVYGEIDLRTNRMNAEHCTFRASGSEEAISYAPFEIEGYRFTKEGKYYVSRYIEMKRGQRQPVFLEYLVQGIKSLYYYEETGYTDIYFIDKDGALVKVDAPRLDSDMLVALNGRDRYIPILRYVFDDYPALDTQIDKTKFDRKSLIELTKSYHYAVCTTGEECVEFETEEKAPPRMRWTLAPYAGVTRYSYAGLMRSDALLLVGVTFTIANPRWSDSFSAVVDLSYSRASSTDTSVFSSKLGVKYTYPKGVVRPFAEVGVNLDFGHSLNGSGVTVMPGYYARAGVDIPLSRKGKCAIRLSFLYKGVWELVDKIGPFTAWGATAGFVF